MWSLHAPTETSFFLCGELLEKRRGVGVVSKTGLKDPQVCLHVGISDGARPGDELERWTNQDRRVKKRCCSGQDICVYLESAPREALRRKSTGFDSSVL